MARRDLYKILQVDPEAEPEVVQAAYRRLARKYHPDVAADAEAARASAARMAEINEAWSVLGDPHRRASYDADRNASAARPPHGGAEQARERAAPAPGGAAGSWGARSGDAWSGQSAWRGASSTGGTGSAEGSVGPPPGNPSGSVLNFGRYTGWSLGEIARHDPDFLERLDRIPIGRRYHEEIDQILRRLGMRGPAQGTGRDAGPFRRR